MFSTFSQSLNPSVAILGHTKHRNERFPTLLYTFTSEIPTLSFTWSLMKGTYFGRRLPV